MKNYLHLLQDFLQFFFIHFFHFPFLQYFCFAQYLQLENLSLHLEPGGEGDGEGEGGGGDGVPPPPPQALGASENRH